MSHYPIRITVHPGYTMFIDGVEVTIFEQSPDAYDTYRVSVWDPDDDCPFAANTEWHIDEFHERAYDADEIRIVRNEVLKRERIAKAEAEL